jgi:DNA-binding MarR family transcriptional regulator
MARHAGGEFHELLNRGYQRFNRLQRGEKKCFGVTMPQCMLIEALFARGPMAVRELAEHLGLDDSTVTRLVDVLVRDGVVLRERPATGDRRRVFVMLTAEGKSLGAKLVECADAYCGRILEKIPAAKRGDVVSALSVLVAAMDELPGNCC